MKCASCGVRHVWPIPTQTELDERFTRYYASALPRLPMMFEQSRDKVLRKIAQFVQQRVSGGNILDVGCGSGYFLGKFFNVPAWTRFGVEVSPETADQAKGLGIHVEVGSLASYSGEPDSFDVVVVLDTFYYFRDPRAACADILRLLRPGGLLMIEVPAAGTRLLRVGSNPDRLDLFYYSPAALVRLLRESRFAVEAIVPLPANRQTGIARQIAYSGFSLAATMLFYLSLKRFVMSPRFAVAARKPQLLQSN
jgi:SAM-dependent methyltransferase